MLISPFICKDGHATYIYIYYLAHEEKARKVLSTNDILEANKQKDIFLFMGNQVTHTQQIMKKSQEIPAVHVRIG